MRFSLIIPSLREYLRPQKCSGQGWYPCLSAKANPGDKLDNLLDTYNACLCKGIFYPVGRSPDMFLNPSLGNLHYISPFACWTQLAKSWRRCFGHCSCGRSISSATRFQKGKFNHLCYSRGSWVCADSRGPQH